MPFSQSGQISTIIQAIENIKPSRILDVGVGMGQYGYLCRMNLEHLNLFEIDGSQAQLRDRSQWQIVIDGIEGFAAYLTPVHNYVYNQIMIGEALTVLRHLPDQAYELVIAIDILEHFEKEQGQLFLAELQRVTSKTVLISTPKDFIEQEVEANPLENHRSHWLESDFIAAGYTHILANPDSWIALAHKP